MKTFADVENLIAQWKEDPTWNLSTTEGFEEYKPYLELVEQKYTNVQAAQEQKRKQLRAQHLECSVSLVEKIEYLEYQIKTLYDHVYRENFKL